MKNICYLLIPLLFVACKKDSQQQHSQKLVEIKSASKTVHTYEYDRQRLTKMNFYTFCTIPSDEVSLQYQNGRVVKVVSKTRSLFSSTSAACNPAAGITTEETLVYDGSGRLSRTERGTSYSTYLYNSGNQVITEKLYQANGTLISTTSFKYDSRGNIIEETGATGSTNYFYDDKDNPYYLMKQKPSYISAFTTSPNNVIRGTTASGGIWERVIFEYENNLPKKINENGTVYEYIYK